jgi:hypothetical protein
MPAWFFKTTPAVLRWEAGSGLSLAIYAIRRIIRALCLHFDGGRPKRSLLAMDSILAGNQEEIGQFSLSEVEEIS